jgi:hypothetical protein
MPGVTFAELMASMYIALMSLLFFLQYSPAIINTLFNRIFVNNASKKRYYILEFSNR